ncbi:hypothetical protein Tco_0865900, partial [Tanacetum coccineum]
PQLTDIVLDITPPQQSIPLKKLEDPSFTTHTVDRGKGIARDTKLQGKLLKKFSEAKVDPKSLRSLKGGKEFLEKRDVEYKVLQREHLDKLKKSRELKRKRFNQFGNFGVIEWDELSVIIPKTKNKVVEELMKSLCKKYERLKEIPGELGINSSFPLPEQDPSLSLSRKRKALELEPEVRIVSLECNHSLPKGIQFVNNKVNEIPEHGIFFIDSCGDQAFQKTSDIHKVEVESWQ